MTAADASTRVRVLVPVKAFARAKGRLSAVLDPSQRSALARRMAAVVVTAAEPLPVTVVCDDDEVADWARSIGADICWTPGLDLNGALTEAVTRAAADGVQRVVLAHADLPFADSLAHLAEVPADRVVIVPDRHCDGTNVMSLPTSPTIELSYGPGSRARHAAAAGAAGLEVVEVVDDSLAWDIDEPADLSTPPELGTLAVPHTVASGGGRRRS